MNNTPLRWHTFLLGGNCDEIAQFNPHLSHAVNLDTGKPLCRVTTKYLCMDDSLCAVGELPDCPRCIKVIKKRT